MTTGPDTVAIVVSPTVVEISLAPSIDVVEVIAQGAQGAPGIQASVLAQLGGTMATLSCVKLADDGATILKSTDVDCPFVDGVLLESGHLGDFREVATLYGFAFESPLLVPGSNLNTLYLGQTGQLTNMQPSAASGDVWFVVVARKKSDYIFTFAPEVPIKLT